ncbi:hypothetical protein HCG49_16995 [Arenibacter sp. 6A1]|uniref:hypothetical protein n=1 Tax=Arenibacter sp. 6A1 TaxID=2720391 RepID=UPI001445EAD4|nr:hypothetical protein [Arenibacter sp. 6A1]NKI28253.1 hypothetical protein [Arenibacter sp. 6A1]
MAIKVETIGAAASEVSGAFSHTEIYVGLLRDFETLTEPKGKYGTDAATTLAELVEISAPHTFKVGFGFTKVKAIQESVILETAQLGNKPSPVQENKMTFQMLGSDAEILGFKRHVKGEDLIVLGKEFASGNVRQIGSAKYAAAVIESTSKIDGTVEGENATTFVVQDKQMYDAPIYKGDITLMPTV